MTSTIGPDYRRVIDLIRSKVTSGEWQVGQRIPSTLDLIALTGLSITSVRRGVQQLQADGILEGHPGKGVFVKALPEEADHERADAEALSEEFAGLRQEVRELAKSADSAGLSGRLAQLEARVGRIEAILINLHARLAFPNPYGGERDDTQKAARRGRAAR